MNSTNTAISEEQLRSLLKCAILAPSSHNTQPWRFGMADGAIMLFADRTRSLPANDPDDRELTISCGCALMNLRVAAAHAGIAVEIDACPNPDDRDLLATISFNKHASESAEEGELFDSINGRRTYRKSFASKKVSVATLKSLSSAVATENAWLEVIETKDYRQKVAELVAKGDAAQWSNPKWRKELAAWMHSRRQGDGLTVPALIAPLARFMVRNFNMGKLIGGMDKQVAEDSPALVVLGTPEDNVNDWLAAGQALQKLLLSAHAEGLQASYLNQPIQVAWLRPKLQRLLSHDGCPQILLRLGYPKEDIDATPRRSLGDVVE
ncbi:Acg family FMN-binding oxidoreductase [Pseudidiomarina insulisalsae]|uniref:Nitroreductase n=1 Tax=Pseudidiomarina insulisalsae TaxID=575789 RepID=A0A432YCB8_9GAMM|nr:nitroreductase family protein [Pseudidiomarina insulisalsae]RUO58619.1 nitroreductase [Pseudidiomarina insulisalsae]